MQLLQHALIGIWVDTQRTQHTLLETGSGSCRGHPGQRLLECLEPWSPWTVFWAVPRGSPLPQALLLCLLVLSLFSPRASGRGLRYTQLLRQLERLLQLLQLLQEIDEWANSQAPTGMSQAATECWDLGRTPSTHARNSGDMLVLDSCPEYALDDHRSFPRHRRHATGKWSIRMCGWTGC